MATKGHVQGGIQMRLFCVREDSLHEPNNTTSQTFGLGSAVHMAPRRHPHGRPTRLHPSNNNPPEQFFHGSPFDPKMGQSMAPKAYEFIGFGAIHGPKSL